MKAVSTMRTRESGMTLLVTMVMLVLLTLFVLSGIRVANIGLRITGNFQWQKEMEMLTDSAIEQLVTTSTTFDDTAVQNGTAVDKDICQDGTVVSAGLCTLTNPKIGTVAQPRCTLSGPASGYTKKLGEIAPEDNNWIIKANVIDSFSGAQVTVYKGVIVRMLAEHCPQ